MAYLEPRKKPEKKDRTIEDILNKDNRMMRSPVLWFFLLTIPVILCFYVALTQAEPPAAEPPKMVEYRPPGVPKPRPPSEVLGEGELNQRGAGPVCDYKEWVGKQADAAAEEAMKAERRAYRILPPGSMMTQDYSPGRVNFVTDAGGKITRVWCG